MNELNEKTLPEVESFMRDIEHDIKKGMAYLALSLAHIKKNRLYIEVAKSFKDYVQLERTHLKYKKAIHLCRIGEIYDQFRDQLTENNILLSENMTKVSVLNEDVLVNDPMIYSRIKSLSCRELADHVKKFSDRISDYPGGEIDGNVSVNGASLYIGGEKVKGINLNDIREGMKIGKRPFVVLIDDKDNEVRRVQRRIKGVV